MAHTVISALRKQRQEGLREFETGLGDWRSVPWASGSAQVHQSAVAPRAARKQALARLLAPPQRQGHPCGVQLVPRKNQFAQRWELRGHSLVLGSAQGRPAGPAQRRVGGCTVGRLRPAPCRLPAHGRGPALRHPAAAAQDQAGEEAPHLVPPLVPVPQGCDGSDTVNKSLPHPQCRWCSVQQCGEAGLGTSLMDRNTEAQL